MNLYRLDENRIVNLDLMTDCHWQDRSEVRDGVIQKSRSLVLTLAAPHWQGVGAMGIAPRARQIVLSEGAAADQLWDHLNILMPLFPDRSQGGA